MRGALLVLVSLMVFCAACRSKPDPGPLLNRIAEQYVRLALAVGNHDENFVDAYYGPEEWKAQTLKENRPLRQIQADALELQRQLKETDTGDAPEEVRERHRFLTKQAQAISCRLSHYSGGRIPFDEETRLLYDAEAPVVPESHFAGILAEIEKLAPGKGPLAERVEMERKKHAIPADKLLKVFGAAIDEARRRTKQHISLPPDESFEVELVSGKPWSAYNWYKGNARSLIQVNTDLPVDINFAIQLACHEGYPGHHVYNSLLESRLRNERGWVEYCIYPLFSPESLIAEGTAEYGVELVLPPAQRLAFTRDVLFPLAGLNPAGAESHFRLVELTDKLREGEIQAARAYLNGEKSRENAIEWLMQYTLLSRERAEKRMGFIDAYRGYIINYGYGRRLVAAYVKSKGAHADGSPEQWRIFEQLLSNPVVPSQLTPIPPGK